MTTSKAKKLTTAQRAILACMADGSHLLAVRRWPDASVWLAPRREDREDAHDGQDNQGVDLTHREHVAWATFAALAEGEQPMVARQMETSGGRELYGLSDAGRMIAQAATPPASGDISPAEPEPLEPPITVGMAVMRKAGLSRRDTSLGIVRRIVDGATGPRARVLWRGNSRASTVALGNLIVATPAVVAQIEAQRAKRQAERDARQAAFMERQRERGSAAFTVGVPRTREATLPPGVHPLEASLYHAWLDAVAGDDSEDSEEGE